MDSLADFLFELSDCQLQIGAQLSRDGYLLCRGLTVFGRVDDKASIPYLIHIVSYVCRSARLRLSSASSSIKKAILDEIRDLTGAFAT
jgi:hypothetical protein